MSVAVVFLVMVLVIGSWTGGRGESYVLAMRSMEVRLPPSFHAVDKRSASLRRLLANQTLQGSEHRLIIGLVGVLFSRCGEAAIFGSERRCPFDMGEHATLGQRVGNAERLSIPRYGEYRRVRRWLTRK